MTNERAAGFITDLDCHWKPDSDCILCLDSPLIYYSRLITAVVEVPAGFESDGSSVPRVPIAYMLYGGRSPREGVLHDYLYRIDAVPAVTRHQADGIFLEAMKSRGKKWWIRQPMYAGVVAGGWPWFRQHTVDHQFND